MYKKYLLWASVGFASGVVLGYAVKNFYEIKSCSKNGVRALNNSEEAVEGPNTNVIIKINSEMVVLDN